MKSTLLIDSHHICYRSMFTIGDLLFEDKGTGVIFGFLRQIQDLAVRFDYPQFIFAWDSTNSYRREMYPEYKRKDKKMTPEMVDLLNVAKPQFHTTRTQILPQIGFNNNLLQTGLEADDLIAQFYIHNSYEKMVIVSSDNDLYQLLDSQVKMWNIKDKKFYTNQNLKKEWGVDPASWVRIKAIAGCLGDNIKGVPGVGYITAIKEIQGLLKGKKHDAIQANKELIDFNWKLVCLPHPKTKPITLVPDTFSLREFEDICLKYGFNSMLNKRNYEIWKKILHA